MEFGNWIILFLQPNGLTKPQKEGNESFQFLNLLGGKCEHGRQKMDDDQESDPRLFSSTLSKGLISHHYYDYFSIEHHNKHKSNSQVGINKLMFNFNGDEDNLKVAEIFNFTQDDLMTEDILILDCHSIIYVWVGHEVTPSQKTQALNIGQVNTTLLSDISY